MTGRVIHNISNGLGSQKVNSVWHCWPCTVSRLHRKTAVYMDYNRNQCAKGQIIQQASPKLISNCPGNKLVWTYVLISLSMSCIRCLRLAHSSLTAATSKMQQEKLHHGNLSPAVISVHSGLMMPIVQVSILILNIYASWCHILSFHGLLVRACFAKRKWGKKEVLSQHWSALTWSSGTRRSCGLDGWFCQGWFNSLGSLDLAWNKVTRFICHNL